MCPASVIEMGLGERSGSNNHKLVGVGREKKYPYDIDPDTSYHTIIGTVGGCIVNFVTKGRKEAQKNLKAVNGDTTEFLALDEKGEKINVLVEAIDVQDFFALLRDGRQIVKTI
jgi:hypothetical protein